MSQRKSSFQKYFVSNHSQNDRLSPKPILKHTTQRSSVPRESSMPGKEVIQQKRLSWGKSKVLEFLKPNDSESESEEQQKPVSIRNRKAR